MDGEGVGLKRTVFESAIGASCGREFGCRYIGHRLSHNGWRIRRVLGLFTK